VRHDKNLLYVGPSWAYRSFDTLYGTENNYTNLLKLLEIDALNLSQCGASNTDCLLAVEEHLEKCTGIIWIYCEPIKEVPRNERVKLIKNEKFWEERELLNQSILSEINDLGIPIALIGAHSDIKNCNYSNIEVIHPSWQKFLAETVNVKLEHGWGAEVAHECVIPNTRPSVQCVNLISGTLNSWTQMELKGVFQGVHPNTRGNELFAQEIKNNINLFIKNL
jgi:hypothetical protein